MARGRASAVFVAFIAAWVVLNASHSAADEPAAPPTPARVPQPVAPVAQPANPSHTGPTTAELQAEIRAVKNDADWAFKLSLGVFGLATLVLGTVTALKISEHFAGFNKAVQALTAKVDERLAAWQKDAEGRKTALEKIAAVAKAALTTTNTDELRRLAQRIDEVEPAIRGRLNKLSDNLASLSRDSQLAVEGAREFAKQTLVELHNQLAEDIGTQQAFTAANTEQLQVLQTRVDELTATLNEHKERADALALQVSAMSEANERKAKLAANTALETALAKMADAVKTLRAEMRKNTSGASERTTAQLADLEQQVKNLRDGVVRLRHDLRDFRTCQGEIQRFYWIARRHARLNPDDLASLTTLQATKPDATAIHIDRQIYEAIVELLMSAAQAAVSSNDLAAGLSAYLRLGQLGAEYNDTEALEMTALAISGLLRRARSTGTLLSLGRLCAFLDGLPPLPKTPELDNLRTQVTPYRDT